MATTKAPPLADTPQELSTMAEFNDTDYWRDVLLLDAESTEDLIDKKIIQQAAILGVEIAPPSKGHISLCDSSVTVESRHARTGSTGSQASVSTDATSRYSSDVRKKENRQSTSFVEYDKFLEQGQTGAFLAAASEPAPSIFSVSTRKSYSSIRSNFKNRFRLRRNKESVENLK